MSEEHSRFSIPVPSSVVGVCKTLRIAGYEAYAVGGAVRDAILGKVPSDWDVTSSATPDQVVALFPKTIPTGIDHGTVTVLTRECGETLPIEVTTFRGESGYTDSRRPDNVTFGVPLVEDLARRDFVVNAIAYDPIDKQLQDPFGGVEDIKAKRIRAVGEAKNRFLEDGLRVMRAVRFCAQLDFTMEQETEAAISSALGSLKKVSRERVLIELTKLLLAERPGYALTVGNTTGVWEQILPEIVESAWEEAIPRVASAPANLNVRLALLFLEVPAKDVTSRLRKLTAKNATISAVAALQRGVIPARSGDKSSLPDSSTVRQTMAKVGRVHSEELVLFWECTGFAEWARIAKRTLHAKVPLSTTELAVSGRDLMEELSEGPGPWLGECLTLLLEKVLADPSVDTKDALLKIAKSKFGTAKS